MYLIENLYGIHLRGGQVRVTDHLAYVKTVIQKSTTMQSDFMDMCLGDT